MTKLTRRRVLATGTAAVLATRLAPKIATTRPARRILTLVVDKTTGTLRAVDKLVR